MDISIALPFLVAVAGLALFVFASGAKSVEVGRLMFFGGLLAGLLRFAGHAALHIGG